MQRNIKAAGPNGSIVSYFGSRSEEPGQIMTEDKTIKALEKIKDKIANYEIKINKAYTGENDFTIIFNTVYSIIDTQIDITKGSRTDQTGAEEPKQNERTAKGRTGAYMENTEEFKQKLRNRFKEIYKECGNDYQKYVERLEELEKAGKIKTEWLRRDDVKSIWDK